MRFWKGKHWMVQMGRWAGPVNLGIHAALRPGGPHYLDIHLPFLVVTIGNVHAVEYPPWSWFSARDASTGVKYGNGHG